ncbi:carboxyl transferase domain-containing protein [Dactylosporangium sucinum]|uniref:Propionyl-CoA carboxylase beta chain 6 n=1 Tax=Dactylosporangium sucinum TaxID=1424081 RepID=A0A917TYQ6_9ACTN|nr:carboxyl transferase domain-containing protein [Dactylosporangium sucinum]GGM42068.1 putative propionyl-CoA carboxylase beta chain 6 [Dactylosporangium sucinum]
MVAVEGRLDALLDRGSLQLLHPQDDSGVLGGRGSIDGVPVIAYATDPARLAGALGDEGCRHIVDAIDAAVRERRPVLGLWHSAGTRLTEGLPALDAVGQVFAATVRASGRVPQLSVVLGPAAAGAAYAPALTDVVVVGGSGRIFATGPDVPGTAPGRPGLAHLTAPDEASALAAARRVTALLGRPGRICLDDVTGTDDLAGLLPAGPGRPYDVRPLVDAVLDAPGLELHAGWAANIVTSLGRLGGRTIGVVANNPLHLGGALDAPAAEKAARFVRTCDALGVPLVVLADVPGHLPGLGPDWDGVVPRCAKLVHAFAEAVVPRVTLVTRRAYGGAYLAMNSRSLGATAVFAWPGAEVAVMGASAAVHVLHRRRLAEAPAHERDQLHARLVKEQTEAAGGVHRALEIGVVDELVEPPQTRRRLAAALAAAPPARGAHSNIPL